MRKTLLLIVVVLFAVSGFAQVTYNNFTGYSPYWNPFGNPNTATYGRDVHSAQLSQHQSGGLRVLHGRPGNLWEHRTGRLHCDLDLYTDAGTLLYSSPEFNYPNTGNAEIQLTTGGLTLTPGADYVMFLSVSQYYGQSSGLSYVSSGLATIPGGGFAYYNNSGNFNELFTNNWDNYGLTPDWGCQPRF